MNIYKGLKQPHKLQVKIEMFRNIFTQSLPIRIFFQVTVTATQHNGMGYQSLQNQIKGLFDWWNWWSTND